MAVESPAPADAARDEILRRQARTGWPACLASASLALSLLLVLWEPARAAPLLAWACTLAAVLAARVAVGAAHRRAAPATAPPAAGMSPAAAAAWVWRYRVADLVHGLGWAAAAWWLPADDALRLPVLTAALVIVAVGGFVFTPHDPPAAFAFALPPLGAAGTVLLQAPGGAWSAVLAVACGMAGVAYFVSARGRADLQAVVAAQLAAEARMAELRRVAEEADAARRALSDQHRLMTRLLGTTQQGYWHVDTEGVTLDLNPAMCRLLGRPREAVMGRPAHEFFEGESLAVLRRELAARHEGLNGAYEIDIVRPDGSVRRCFNVATPVHDTQGQRIGSVGLWTDITALHEHEQALVVYELAANSLADPVSVVDEQQIYRMVNDAWCRTTGIAREAALGRHAESVLPAAYSGARRAAFREALRTNTPQVVGDTAVALPQLAGRAFETTYCPYTDPQGRRHVAIVNRDVTLREQQRAAIAETAEYLERTLNATGDAIFASDAAGPDQPVRFANRQLLELWRIPASAQPLTPRRIVQHAMAFFVDREAELAEIQRIIASGEPHVRELRLTDGRVLVRRCVPARVGAHTVRVWSFRDVTAERRTLELVRASEAEQRALLEAFPGHIARVDADLRYTYVNRALARLCGRPAEQIVGQPVGHWLGDEGLPLRAAIERAHAEGSATLEFHHPAGAGTDLQITVARGVHPGTGVPAFYAFGLDITERKRAEQALQASRTELRAVLDAFPGLISAVDDDLRYVFVNQRLADAVGRTPAEMMGRHLSDSIGPARFTEVMAELARARAGDSSPVERHHPASARRPAFDLEVTHVPGPPRPDGTRTMYSFAVDISARKRAEEALIAARDEAERANLAKSQFLSQMSHELRTPMNAILGLGQLLASDPARPLQPVQQAYVEEMLRGARHLLDLINEVLDLGRIEAGQLAVDCAPVPLAELLEECVNLLRPLAAEHEVQVQLLPDEVPAVLADRLRLKQVLLNLLGNAIKYNRRPGSVTLGASSEAGGVRLIVRDTGRGLTAEQQRRLFRPFERLDAAREGVEGTGIGLALSRRLVEAMQGAIGVESEPGLGSTFWVRLPRAVMPVPSAPPPPAALAAPAGAPLPPAAGRPDAPVVLYVEDNPVNRFVMEAIFERLPAYRLVSAATPGEGLYQAAALRPAMILLDVQLPGMDGAEVLAHLKADRVTAGIPVVAVSANAMADDIATMLAAGARAYLTKPVELEKLSALVHQYAAAV